MPDESRHDTTASDQLARLLETYWEYRLADDPLLASNVGEHRYDGLLPRVTPSAYFERAGAYRTFLGQLATIDPTHLQPADRVNYDTFARVISDDLDEIELRGYYCPINTMGGFHTRFAQLPGETVLETVPDFENLIERFRAFKTFVSDHIELMRWCVRDGFRPPIAVLRGVEDGIRAHIVDDPDQSQLVVRFGSMPETIEQRDRQRLRREAVEAVANSVIPAYRALLAFMHDEYFPAARPTLGVSALPNGQQLYEHRVRSFTTPTLTAGAVHDIGVKEVERITTAMNAALDGAGFRGSIREFGTSIRSDSRFWASSPDDLMQRTALILKRMDGELPRLFGKLPRTPYGIRAIPDDVAPTNTTAYYLEPAGDGTRAGFYYVNTYDLPSRPLYELEALSLHEAVPGHHLQIALQYEQANVPAFRRFREFTAFSEGWGLYAERLGKEVGFYTDVYSEFGRLSYEMWRACRLVVDSGVHHMSWSRERAIEFMLQHTLLSHRNVESEVDRYAALPGQALAYQIGMLKIVELRGRAQEAQGVRFDLRQFHDFVLSQAALPLDVLEDAVDGWLKSGAGLGRSKSGKVDGSG